MTAHVIWGLVAAFWALALWDMVRRWAFATATRDLKAQVDVVRADLDKLGGEIADAKLPARVKQLETVVIALKTHAETARAARPNAFLRKAGG